MSNYKEIEAAFQAHRERRTWTDTVPSGWFTARDMAKQKKVTVREAQRVLRDLTECGAVELKHFKVKTGLRIYPVIHYKPCDTTTRKSAKHR
jgi:predicted transcriptional regulator